jgi:hypothetical protein
MNRKQLQRQYKETRRPMGVYRVRNARSGCWFLGASVDIPAMLNRQRFQLDAGSHPNSELQRDWKVLGAEAFTFETLDLLAPPEDEPGYEPQGDLRALEAMWREKLRQTDGPGYHKESR